MNTITLNSVSDELLRRVAERAGQNHRSLEDEVMSCLQICLESDDVLEEAIPASRWPEIEESLALALKETPTEFTEADWAKFENLARGSKTP